jgi:hypothetical protein
MASKKAAEPAPAEDVEEEEEEVEYIPDRTSLLEVMHDKVKKVLRSYPNGEPTSRVIYVAQYNDQMTSKEDLRAIHEGFMRAAMADSDAEENLFTGILLCMGRYMCHYLESSTNQLMAYMRVMYRAQTTEPRLPYGPVKVLNVQDEVPVAFPVWAMRIVQKPEDGDQYGTLPERVQKLQKGLIKLGKSLLDDRDGAMARLDKLNETTSLGYGLIPSEDAVQQLVEHRLGMDLDEYIDAYHAITEIESEEETEWPAREFVAF